MSSKKEMTIPDNWANPKLWSKYEQLFGEKPPIFGYEEEDILPAIIKALETKKPMPGMHEIIEKELGISDEDREDGKGIIL